MRIPSQIKFTVAMTITGFTMLGLSRCAATKADSIDKRIQEYVRARNTPSLTEAYNLNQAATHMQRAEEQLGGRYRSIGSIKPFVFIVNRNQPDPEESSLEVRTAIEYHNKVTNTGMEDAARIENDVLTAAKSQYGAIRDRIGKIIAYLSPKIDESMKRLHDVDRSFLSANQKKRDNYRDCSPELLLIGLPLALGGMIFTLYESASLLYDKFEKRIN